MEVNNIVLIDLCARLPYRVKVEHNGEVKSIARYDTRERFELTDGTITSYVNLKPYLRPMSSMTEEEKLYLELNYGFELHGDVLSNLHIIKGSGFYEREGEYVEPTEHRQYKHITIDTVSELIKWLNAHHFDYRGLIEKGIALRAPEGMYSF